MKLNNDIVRTGGAILLIAVIVVATFLYGNSQRQEQVRKDQAAKQEEQRKADDQAKATTETPAANSNQSATSATPSQTAATSPAKTPETGGEVMYLIPVGALLVGYQATRRSHKSLHTALRSR